MTAMTPADLMARFPIGSPIELSQYARQRIMLIQELDASIDYVREAVRKELGDCPPEVMGDPAAAVVRLRAENAIAELCWERDPSRASLSESMHPRVDGCPLFHSFSKVSSALVLALVCGDLVKEGLPRSMLSVLRLRLRPNATIVVMGYEFDDVQLGLSKTEASNLRAPDAVAGFEEFDEEDEDEVDGGT